MDVPDQSRRTGVLLAAGGMAVLSTEAVTIRLAGVTAWDAVFWIGWCTVVVAFGWIRVVGRTGPLSAIRQGGAPLVTAGALQGATTACFVAAVSTTSVANVVVLLSGAPLAAALIAWWWLGERVTARVAAGIGTAIVGSVVVVTGTAGGGGHLVGDLLALGAVVCFGATTTLLRRHPELSRPAVIGLGGLVMVAVGGWNVAPGAMDPRAWGFLVLVGAITSPAARVLLALAPRHLPAAQVGLFVPVETVLAIIWARLVFGERPTTTTLAGAGIITAGLFVAVLGELRGSRVSPVDGGRRRRAPVGTSLRAAATPGRSPWRRRR